VFCVREPCGNGNSPAEDLTPLIRDGIGRQGGPTPPPHTHQHAPGEVVAAEKSGRRRETAISNASSVLSAARHVSSRANARTGKLPMPLNPRRHGKESEAHVGERTQVSSMCSTIATPGAEQDRVGRGRVPSLSSSMLSESIPTRIAPLRARMLGSVFREEGMLAARVRIRTPVLCPTRCARGQPFLLRPALVEVCGIDRTFLRRHSRARTTPVRSATASKAVAGYVPGRLRNGETERRCRYRCSRAARSSRSGRWCRAHSGRWKRPRESQSLIVGEGRPR